MIAINDMQLIQLGKYALKIGKNKRGNQFK